MTNAIGPRGAGNGFFPGSLSAAEKQPGEGTTGVYRSAGSVRERERLFHLQVVFPGNGPVVDPAQTPTSWSSTRHYAGPHAAKKVV
jgi:hypothetical protein